MKSFIASLAIAFSVVACGPMTPSGDAGNNDSGTTPTDSGTGSDSSAECLPTGNAANGAMLVMTNACGSCHGADLGGGTTPAGQNLHNDGTGAGGWNACQFREALRNGKDDEGRTLCASMPRYPSSAISDQALADILAHLKTLTTAGRTTAACN